MKILAWNLVYMHKVTFLTLCIFQTKFGNELKKKFTYPPFCNIRGPKSPLRDEKTQLRTNIFIMDWNRLIQIWKQIEDSF